ncbi:MAG: lipid II:glycine glycyltransferase FemX [Sphingobacterium sp.]|uniref:lipid II:glycine glycyltransferase FemX n=1 Tax=Sphingobacterium sp. JB170 TaxID=1434842 RepID=UPI00097EB84E|nr:peptidoglycan bridge formation glycyltransferase FemA/FemB family protein [Sphingobacterium sp. JB170]SJN45675.1 tRNA-dependent lipid II--amino acid ligase [Sphingobacterium sp. JB170]
MIAEIQDKDSTNIFKTSIIQQTSYWSEVKKLQGITTKAFDFRAKNEDLFVGIKDESYFIGDLLVLIQKVDEHSTIAYVPYGPEVEPSEENQGCFLEQLSEGLRTYLPSKCIMIRYDLSWESLWAKDDNCYDLHGNWIGAPDRKMQELRFNFATDKWNLKKANTDVLPSNTVFMDLNKESDTLLGTMKPKTRYNIKLAKRKGVEISSLGIESLDIWYELYRQTAQRNNFFLHDINYFKVILSARANDSLSPAKVYLLVAHVDNRPLAAMFLVITGVRGTYLYGASATENRNYMATYALQWRAMQLAKELGCSEYDFFGVSPVADQSHPMFGLYRFKTGFGGKLYRRMGCWDYPLDKVKYRYYSSMEFKNQAYHLG